MKEKMTFKKKLENILLLTAFIYIMFGMLGPLEIYVGNKHEFEFGFHDFFWMFSCVYLIVWVIGCLIISLLPCKLFHIASRLFFVLGIEFYIQNMFLNKQLIMKDGSSMQWEKMKGYLIFNAVVWVVIAIVIVCISIFLKERWNKIAKYISLSLCVMQLIAVVSLILQVPLERVYEQEYKIDATEQFALAEDENIIVFVLDKYANDQFIENLEDHPELYEELKDFTFYDNANSIYEDTSNALCILLSGQIPEKYKSDKAEIWGRSSVKEFYDILHNHGYSTFISTRDCNNVFGDISQLVDKYDNVKKLDIEFDRALLFKLMSKMTIYKYSPYVVKPKFEVMTYSFTDVIHPEGYSNSLYLNPEFYQGLVNERFYIKKGTSKLFKVQHIQGMHGDFNMDINAMEIPESEGTAIQSREGLNVIILEYLNQIKELGLYDNATIIILADHGDSLHDFGMQPTVLIKRKGEEHDKLQVNSAPISHADFVPTILSYLGEDYSEYGTSIYDWKEGDRRKRTVHLDTKTVDYYTDNDELEEVAGDY